MQSTFALLTRFAEDKQRHTIQSRNFQCKVKFVIHANAPRHILRSKSHKCAVRSRTPATCSTRLQRPFLILFPRSAYHKNPRSAYHCPRSRIALDCIQTLHLRLLFLPSTSPFLSLTIFINSFHFKMALCAFPFFVKPIADLEVKVACTSNHVCAFIAANSLHRNNSCSARAAADAAERAASNTASCMVPSAATWVHTSCAGMQATWAGGDSTNSTTKQL